MNILTQFNQIITRNLEDKFKNLINDMINSFNTPYSIKNYEQLIIELDKLTSNISVDIYKKILHSLDEEFMNSTIRKQLYESKGFVTKTLLTKFGYIDFKRRRYVDKLTGESYMFVDRFLGLIKYTRLDSFVIADLCEEASSNSYSKAGRIVSISIGTKIKYEDDPNKYIINRATARNNVLKAIRIMVPIDNDDTKIVEELNVMLDEKFVGSQFNNGVDHMIKAAVVFEGTYEEYTNRTRLKGKKVFGSIGNDLLEKVVDYIYCNYDTDKLKKINFMGDGALWIKSFSFNSIFKFNKEIIIRFGLDHFHFSQSIQRILTNKYKSLYGKNITEYVIHDKKDGFIEICNMLIELNAYRKDTIEENMKYILNNWNYIQTTIHSMKYKCSMESNISHVFADIFTSRPKSYSKQGLEKLLIIRLLKINGYDIKKIYIDSLNKIKEEEKIDLIETKVSYKIKNLKTIKYASLSNREVTLLSSSVEDLMKVRKLVAI